MKQWNSIHLIHHLRSTNPLLNIPAQDHTNNMALIDKSRLHVKSNPSSIFYSMNNHAIQTLIGSTKFILPHSFHAMQTFWYIHINTIYAYNYLPQSPKQWTVGCIICNAEEASNPLYPTSPYPIMSENCRECNANIMIQSHKHIYQYNQLPHLSNIWTVQCIMWKKQIIPYHHFNAEDNPKKT